MRRRARGRFQQLSALTCGGRAGVSKRRARQHVVREFLGENVQLYSSRMKGARDDYGDNQNR
jgi:hypothetical protein